MTATNLELQLREKLIELALKQQHKPYVHYASGPNAFDCAGLIHYLYFIVCKLDLYGPVKKELASATTELMYNVIGQLTCFKENAIYKDISKIKSGDILFFHFPHGSGYPGHCGLYLQDFSFLHAISSVGKVVISNLQKNLFYKETLVGYKNILGDEKVLKRNICF